ncbi:choline dehydrogenase [Aeoliella mucimassa]|uniref:Choline dehydrogenase n=2 Tax=Aeoliella mucimassa TaxID=2527972 RepID=A0A518AUS7_9BACT|nr:FAD-dependent oxidoreductase [Aeoliella mucimassa]QDU58476.1 choline dehydrogenase [Aeoliella mucimassa]
MILDSIKEWKEAENDPIVVVGAGAVGIHLSVLLARQGRKVVLLESGNHILSSFASNAYRTEGREHNGIRLGRSVALGGTTNLWGGQLVEFEALDFESRDWVANSGWPVGYEEFSRYFGPTYDALGYEGETQNDEQVWALINRRPPQISDDLLVFLTRWLKQPNLAKHYREDLETNPNLQVVLNTKVVGFAGQQNRVEGVKLADGKGGFDILPGSHFVLGAGTIENARLLLATALDDQWYCPWKENDKIGRYFHDHLGGPVAKITPKDHKEFFGEFSTIVFKGRKYLPKVRSQPSFVRENRILGVQAMLTFEHSVKEHLVFLKQFVKAALGSREIGSITKFFRHAWACLRYLPPLMWTYIVEHRLLVPRGSDIQIIVQAEVEPLPESRITVDPQKRDAYGLPMAVLDWQLSGKELESLACFAEMVKRSFEDSGKATVQIDRQLVDRDPQFLDTLHDTNHQGGGCIMGTSAENGVVDQDLKVFGSDNMFVIGPSIFRTASHANCTFTALTFATRLSKHLVEATHAAD